jgi:hypothetical protein
MDYRWEEWTENGFIVRKAVPTMPRVMSDFVGSLVFLYRTLGDAKSNNNSGGSGFLLGVEAGDQDGLAHVYVVTNRHVVDEGAKVVRIINRNGPPIIYDLTDKDWRTATGDDLAVCLLDKPAWFSQLPMVRAVTMLSENELEDDTATEWSDHPRYGDDVFMASRLANKRLVGGSVAAVRFGTLAASRPVPVIHPDVGTQESFLVEMRSISGHSGSPVFLHYNDYILENAPQHSRGGVYAVRLLGIDWGHLEHIGDGGADTMGGAWAAGIACVVPAWKLTPLLRDRVDLVTRKKREQDWKDAGEIGSAAEGTMDSLPTDEFDQFTHLTQRLLQVSKDELDEKRGES